MREEGLEAAQLPDAKVSFVRYKNGKAASLTSIVLDTQHLYEAMIPDDVRLVTQPHIRKTLTERWITAPTAWNVNTTGVRDPRTRRGCRPDETQNHCCTYHGGAPRGVMKCILEKSVQRLIGIRPVRRAIWRKM